MGLAPAELPDDDAGGSQAYQAWMDEGRHGTMDYMAHNREAGRKIKGWFPPAKSVVLLAYSYACDSGDKFALGSDPRANFGRIAQYARSPDYHDALKVRLKTLRDEIRANAPEARIKLFVDTSPVLERLYGRYAGIGWAGKNTMLISPKIGSFFFLCGLALDQELDYDDPVPDHCGTCNRCLKACPTDAFPAPYELDASKCIAYLNIEHRGPIPEEQREGVGDRLFGCDACQDACPWNRFRVRNPAFEPKINQQASLSEIVEMSEAEFDERFGDTPIERARYQGLLRNALLLMGNSKDKKYRPVLERFQSHADPVIREQAQWSLKSLLLSALAAVLLFTQAKAAQPSTRANKPTDPALPQEPHPREFPQGMETAHEEAPWFVRLILHPVRSGMFLSLPIIDTDPNRGVTYGIMPIWVMKGAKEDSIKSIHAPSLTHNPIFGWTPAYRYYYYPSSDANFTFRAAASQVVDRVVYAHYEDYSFLDREIILALRGQYNVDGSNRFYGIGPSTPKNGESNYRRDMFEWNGQIGRAVHPTSLWHLNISHHLESDKISNGPITRLPALSMLYPTTEPPNYHQDSAVRGFINFDSRDSPVTTTEGKFLEFFGETAQRTIGSDYVYRRYGADARYFLKNPRDDRFVTAMQVQFNQVIGDGVPFYLLPQMGGKYIHRAYGEGRYTDKGLLVGNVEERITAYQKSMGGVTAEFEVAPFVGLGNVFDHPSQMTRRYARPVVGTALRAVAPPQVVGSIDLGVGQEGASVFMDINYSF